MNKQEVIEEIKKLEGLTILDKTINFDSKMIPKGETLEIVNKLDEPEKTVVPQFVADWYESIKYDFEYSLYKLCLDFNKRELQEDLGEWFECDVSKPIETLVKMKLYGYEVEKEQLYTVEIPNPYGRERPILFKNRDGKVSVVFASNPCWRTVKDAKLTEAEIKEDFGWAWPFAKEVKE